AQKQAIYSALAERLAAADLVRPEDLIVSVVHNDREDWSFGLVRAGPGPVPHRRALTGRARRRLHRPPAPRHRTRSTDQQSSLYVWTKDRPRGIMGASAGPPGTAAHGSSRIRHRRRRREAWR